MVFNGDLSILRRGRLRVREPASFWRENMIAVVILLRVLARMWRKQVIKCKNFYHFAIGRGLNLFSINNRANVFGEKSKMKLSGVSFLRTRVKNFKSSLVLVSVLVFKSKALYFTNSSTSIGRRHWSSIHQLGTPECPVGNSGDCSSRRTYTHS